MSKTIQTPSFDKTQLMNSVKKWQGKSVLIVGDIGVDEYILGEVRRISPEAPVPVLEVSSEENRLGMAANVAQNVASLGGKALLLGLVGDDTGAEMISGLLKKASIGTEHLILDSSRPTTRKTRVMAKHHHLVRVDYENRKFIASEIENKILAKIDQLISLCDVVIVEDYAKGLVSQTLIKKVVEKSRAAGKKVLVDPHRTNRSDFYSGVDIIKPNFDESVALSGLNYDELRDHPNKVIEIGEAVMKQTGARELVMTRGKDGMTIFSDGRIISVPTVARKVFDVTGAGDTVIAALALGVSAGLPLPESCMLANYAAGVVVGQVGCVPCSVAELNDYIQS
jgi:rfaE bifunctional protein kinase chain/domain